MSTASNGPRYRGPFEAVLIAYLAVVLAGQWASTPRRELILAGVFSALSLLLIW